MKKADIWSLGMVFFCLINPGSKVPFNKEARKASKLNNWNHFMKARISEGKIPQGDVRYELLQATAWIQVYQAFVSCLKVSPTERPSLQDMKVLLKEKIQPRSYPLSVHQGSALEDAHTLNLDYFQCPANDGTNACVFLAIKIGEFIMNKGIDSWQQLKITAEGIIKTFPEVINPIRNKDHLEDALSAYNVMFDKGMISNCKLNDQSLVTKVFSEEGRKELIDKMDKMDKVLIFTVVPYTFLMGKDGPDYFFVDTHKINETLGGNGNGIVVVFFKCSDAAKWIWKRLASSKVKPSQFQQIIEMELSTTEKSDLIPFHFVSPSQENIEKVKSESILLKSWNKQPCKELEVEIMPKHSWPFTKEGPVGIQGSSVKSRGEKRDEGGDKIILLNSNKQSDNFQHTDKWDHAEVEKWGQYQIPYVQSFRGKLNLSEQLAMVRSQFPKSAKIPQACRRNATFLIDSRQLRHPEDAQSDLNGVFSKCIEVKTHTVDVTSNCTGPQKVKVIANKKKELEKNQLYLRVNRKQNSHGLVRSISYFIEENGLIHNNCIIL